MRIWNHTDTFNFKEPVVTMGIFDGLHEGHKFIINKINSMARSVGSESVVLTFWPHPREVLNKNIESLKYLTSLKEKLILFEKTGIDHLVLIEFTKEFSQLSSCEFIKNILVDKIGVRHLIIGYNHKFGKDQEGDLTSLKECSRIYNFTIEQAEVFKMEGVSISSSLIRNHLLLGELDISNKYLGYQYFIVGRVIEGNRIGREIGFPTANIVPDDKHKLIPGDGVYAVDIKISDNLYRGMLNIGVRPTVSSENNKTIEVHIIDFSGELYDKELIIYFRKRIRDEKKFANREQLRQQLIKDRETAKMIDSGL